MLKSKEIANMGSKEREKKMKELKFEIVKARAEAAKTGSSKVKEAKRTLAKIMTFNKSYKEALNNK